MLFFGYGNGLTSYLVRECRMHAEMSWFCSLFTNGSEKNEHHTHHSHTHTHTQKADVSNGESGEGVGGVFILSINFSVWNLKDKNLEKWKKHLRTGKVIYFN